MMAIETRFGTFDLETREDGYVNITRLCRQASEVLGARKVVGHWLENDATREAVRRLRSSVGGEVVVKITRGPNHQRATWAHPSLASDLTHWLSQRHLRPRRSEGVVYLVTSSLVAVFKIGIWTSDMASLRSRYTTYYGPESDISVWKCADYRGVEKRAIAAFAYARKGNELFDKTAMDACRRYLETECFSKHSKGGI